MPIDRSQGCCNEFRETVCIDVDRVYDCCKDRDCAVDLRVYIPVSDQALLDSAVSVRSGEARLLWTYIDVEALQFNRGFYTVDVRFFISVSVDVFTGVGRPQRIYGLCSFDKRMILFGGEGGAKIFSSRYVPNGGDINLGISSNTPKATVEAVDPVLLSVRAVDACCRCGCGEFDVVSVPEAVSAAFDGPLGDPDQGKRLYATLGLFSIVRLMREVQLLIPSAEFCIPEKECVGPDEDDPCSLFQQMEFPLDQFFPPQSGGACGSGNPCA